MACAIRLSQISRESKADPIRIALIDRNPRLGKKLLLTGNGRCNLTNRSISRDHYHGHDDRFVSFAIREYDNEYTRDFFENLGLMTFYDDSGKAYPQSLHASSVLDCMRYALEESDVCVFVSEEITSIEKRDNGYVLCDPDGVFMVARQVVISCGGAASPFTGSDGSGYVLLEKLGHKVIKPIPGIVQLKTKTLFTKPLSGIKINGSVSLYINDIVVRTEYGEILFTDYGLSGPPVLQLSGLASRAVYCFHDDKENRTEVHIDFMIEKSIPEVEDMLVKRTKAFPRRKLEHMLVGIFHNRVAVRLVKSAIDKNLNTPLSELDDNEIKRIAGQIKNTVIGVTGTMPLANAQITIGGASTKEFDAFSMQSKLCEGLFVCGELLDIDGDCGGYNLQWAWSSAFLAARTISDMYK